jgi:hypothetical protein
VSVSFYGRTRDDQRVSLAIDDPAYLNLANGNARSFLEFLGINPGEEPFGEVTMPEARRAVIRARATFKRRAHKFTREESDTQRPGRPRVIVAGIDEDYLARRVDDFERFLNAVGDRGAASIYWA